MQLFVSRSRAEWLAFPAGQNSFRQVHCWAQRLNSFRGNGAILASPSLIAMISEGVRISDAFRIMQWVTFYPSGHLRSVLVIGPTDRGWASSPERWARSRNGRVLRSRPVLCEMRTSCNQQRYHRLAGQFFLNLGCLFCYSYYADSVLWLLVL